MVTDDDFRKSKILAKKLEEVLFDVSDEKLRESGLEVLTDFKVSYMANCYLPSLSSEGTIEFFLLES